MDNVKGAAQAAVEAVEAVEAVAEDRTTLMALHREARRRRDAAPLTGKARAEAAYEVERIEIQIARIERAMDPPLV